MKSYTAAFGQVYDGDKELDEGILLLMRAPHTYTCEDVCELQCHGGMVVLRNVLAAVIKMVQDSQNRENLPSGHS